MILKCACFYINFIGKRDEEKKQEQGRKIAKEENEQEKQHK